MSKTVHSDCATDRSGKFTPEALHGLPVLRYRKPSPIIAVYFLMQNGNLLYVGQSIDLAQRLRNHDIVGYGYIFDEVYYLPCKKEELDEVERGMIEFYAPPLNRAFIPAIEKARRPSFNLKGKSAQDRVERLFLAMENDRKRLRRYATR